MQCENFLPCVRSSRGRSCLVSFYILYSCSFPSLFGELQALGLSLNPNRILGTSGQALVWFASTMSRGIIQAVKAPIEHTKYNNMWLISMNYHRTFFLPQANYTTTNYMQLTNKPKTLHNIVQLMIHSDSRKPFHYAESTNQVPASPIHFFIQYPSDAYLNNV